MRTLIALFLTLCVVFASAPAWAASPTVTVSIQPIHSLAAKIMDGVGTPQLLLPPTASPHHFSLKPSQARNLRQADLIIWVGPTLEAALAKPISSLNSTTQVLSMMDAPGLTKHPLRKGDDWAHDHGHEHRPDRHGHREDRHSDDPHIWLNPLNGIAMAAYITQALQKLDPQNSGRYADNFRTLQRDITGLDKRLRNRLRAAAGQPYVVFHDGFQYFERRYGLKAIGSVGEGHQRYPSAKRLSHLKHEIAEHNIRCIFGEPQFKSRAVAMLAADSPAKVLVLDPLGASVPPGPGSYSTLLENITSAITGCLAQKSPS